MKYTIEQKDFDKLSQLDRIEYRQIAKNIKEDNKISFLDDLLIAIGIYIFITMWGITMVAINKSFVKEITIIVSMIKFIFILPLIGLIFDYFKIKKIGKQFGELNKKYFNTSISTKKRK